MNPSIGASMTNLKTIFATIDSAAACSIFVDFDGVTHPDQEYGKDYFCHLPLLEEVLCEYPEVDAVISSSWRIKYAIGELRGFFSGEIAPRVLGVTPSIKEPSSNWLPGQGCSHAREWECESWMRQSRPRGTPYVAINDRATWFRPSCPVLFHTDARTGFTPQNQATLRDMIWERL